MKMKQISNVNKVVEDKVNYFIDCINDFLHYAGWEYHFEIENPLSLIDKLIFQVSENPKFHISYFDNYLTNAWFDFESIFIQYSSYEAFKKELSNYRLLIQNNRKAKQSRTAIVQSEYFISTLKNFQIELSQKMMKDAVTNLVSILRCSHTVFELEHDSIIRTYARLIVSEYFKSGRTKRDVREIISQVFSKGMEKFPFPEDIKTISARKEIVSKAQLDEQLFGFYNAFLKKPNFSIVYVRVFGLVLPSEYSIKYNKVTFFSTDHITINKLKSKVSDSAILEFFDERPCLIASVKVDFFTRDTMLDNAVKQIRDEIRYVSATLKQDFIVEESGNYFESDLKLKNVGYCYGKRPEVRQAHQHELRGIEKTVYKLLSRNRSLAKNWLLNFEPLFVNALNTGKISDYWHYLEAILSDGEDAQVQRKVSAILLCNELYVRKHRCINTLYDSLNIFQGGQEILNIEYEELSLVMKELRKGRLSKHITKAKYPFVMDIVKQFQTKLKGQEYREARNYYERILIESREFRNFYLHSGKVHKRSLIKLEYSLPRMVIRFRWAVCEAIKKDLSNSSFDTIINNLIARGERLQND